MGKILLTTESQSSSVVSPTATTGTGRGDTLGVATGCGGIDDCFGIVRPNRCAITEADAEQLDPVVWETRIGDWVLAVVRTTTEAHAITGDGRDRGVWTMKEIGRVLVAFSQQVGEAKQVFAGCEVVDVRPSPFNELTSDDLPF